MTLMTALGPPAVYTKFERPDAEAVKRLGALSASTVHESNRRTGFMRGIRPRVQGSRICGTAVTSLDHAGDNIMIHAAIEICQPGDVLVAATKAPSAHGMFGDLMAELCRARGIAGIITGGGVRDIAILREMPFPAWSAAVAADGTSKSNPGWVNVPIICGEQVVRPGDVIVADDDGVVVVPREALHEVLAAAEAREVREEKSRARYAKGELSLDVAGFRKLIAELGVSYPDRDET